MTRQLNEVGIGAERVLGASIGALEAAFKQPGPSIAGLVALAKAQKLRGFSSDIEARGSALDFTCYLAKLRAALRPGGARLTMYNNNAWDSLINDFVHVSRPTNPMGLMANSTQCRYCVCSCNTASTASWTVTRVRVASPDTAFTPAP
jgi:hypothetical protein